MATHSNILAWRIPWTEESGGYSPWGPKKLDTSEHAHYITFSLWVWCLFCVDRGAHHRWHPGQWPLWPQGTRLPALTPTHIRRGTPWKLQAIQSGQSSPVSLRHSKSFSGNHSLCASHSWGKPSTSEPYLGFSELPRQGCIRAAELWTTQCWTPGFWDQLSGMPSGLESVTGCLWVWAWWVNGQKCLSQGCGSLVVPLCLSFVCVCVWLMSNVGVYSMLVLSRSVVYDSRNPMDCTRLLCPWDSPGKNTGVDCLFLFQEIFPTQGSNPCVWYLLHWQVDSLPLSHLGSPST